MVVKVPTMAGSVAGRRAASAGVGAGARTGGSKPAAQDATSSLTSEELLALQQQGPGALSAVESIVAVPTNMGLFMGGAAAGMVGDRMASTAKKRGWGLMEKIGNVLATPKRWYTELSFSDVGKNLGVGDFFAKATQPVFNATGAIADTVGGATGFNGWRQQVHTAKAEKAFAKAIETANELNLEHAPTAEIRSALQTVKSAALASGSRTRAGSESFFAAKAQLHEAVKAHSGGLAGEAKTLMKKAEKLTGALGHEGAGGHLEKAIYHSERAAHYGDVRGSFSKASEKVGSAKIGPGLMHGSFVALSALSILDDTQSFRGKLGSLRQMYLDLTGEKSVSTIGLLFGSVPAPVARARTPLMVNFGIKNVLDLANILLNIKMNRLGMMSSLFAFGGVTAAASGVDMLVDTNELTFYGGISKAHREGKNISAEAYAEFLTLVSSDLGRSGKDNPMVQKLGELYAAEQIAPGALIKEVESGAMTKRVRGIIAANASKAPKEPAKTPDVAAQDKLWADQFAAQAEKRLAKNEPAAGFAAKEVAKAKDTTEVTRGA